MTTLTTPSKCGISAIIAHSKFDSSVMPRQPKKKVSENLPEMLGSLSGPSAGRHQWQTTRHTIVHEVDLNDPRSTSASTSSCCRDILEGRVNPSSKSASRVPDLLCTETIQSCCDGDHLECPASFAEGTDECKIQHETAPCDCCRHGHSLSSLIRTPDDCRSCLRHMGGGFVSPKYPQIRQRMLKTLNQRRDHSEELIVEHMDPNKWVKPDPQPPVKSIPCGKKESLIILNPELHNDNVDDIVRMIEGTKICNDPKKAAKKARQKEKKQCSKLEDEKRKEEEERQKREEEERLQREQEMREEEERRKAEDLKKQARKLKKKNRKKRDAEKPNTTPSIEESNEVTGHQPTGIGETLTKEYGTVHPLKFASHPSPQDAVRSVEPLRPVPVSSEENKPRMVTIRRHPPNAENQNVVTITLRDDNEGKHPVYMLVNGQLYLDDRDSTAANTNGHAEDKQSSEADNKDNNDKKKKKKKKKNPNEIECLNLKTEKPVESFVPKVRQSDIQLRTSCFTNSGDNGEGTISTVDLTTLSLPAGITITKVPSIAQRHDFCKDVSSPIHTRPVHSNVRETYSHQELVITPAIESHVSILEDRNYAQRLANEDDLFLRKESEEFEEVVSSKTRRKRIKAAKSKDHDGPYDDPDARSSPSSGSQVTSVRRHSDNKPAENGTNVWGSSGKTSKTLKTIKSNRTSTKSSNGIEKPVAHVIVRREQMQRQNDLAVHHGFVTNHTAPVMPRLSRPQYKNGDVARDTYEGDRLQLRPPNVSVEPQHSPLSPETKTFLSMHATSSNAQLLRDDNYSASPPPTLNAQSLHQRNISPPTKKLWNHGDIKPSSLGPFTVQADTPEQSWTPWHTHNWSQYSENPSARVDIECRDNPFSESSNKTYTFQDLMRKTTGKSPIQRPVSGGADNYTQPNNGREYEAGAYFSQQVAGSHPNSVNASGRGSFSSALHGDWHTPGTFPNHEASPFQPNNVYYKEDNVPGMYHVKIAHSTQDNTWNTFKPGNPEPLMPRRHSSMQDAVTNHDYSGKCSPLDQDTEIYKQLYNSGVTNEIRNPKRDSSSLRDRQPEDLGLGFPKLTKVQGQFSNPHLQNYEFHAGPNLKSLWQKQRSQLNCQELSAPVNLQDSMTQQIHWNGAGFCSDFSGGAHR